jgi:hypothetical protein
MYYIKIATFDFNCPICGILVRKGDAYMEDEEGNRYCFCQLPRRTLTPLKEHVNAH